MSKIKKIHVLILPSWYPLMKDEIGGSFFREQAIALNDKGHNVGLIYPYDMTIKSYIKKLLLNHKYPEYEIDSGVSTYRSNYKVLPTRKKNLNEKYLATGLQLFNKYINENGKPDILHVHSIFDAGFLAEEIKRLFNIPYVITEHSTAYSRELLNKDDLIKARSVVDNSSYCIAVSNEFAKLLNKYIGLSVWNYIPNIVNKNFINSELKYKELNDGEIFKFINICLLHKKKNIDLLINAFYILSMELDNIILDIGGSGPDKKRLINLVNKLGIQNKVNFLGNLSRESVLKNIKDSDCFVLSSNYETFGVVLVEALALGVPVIATKCGGPESIINDESGYLVEKNSPLSMANKMMDVYKNKKGFNKKAIRQYCIDNFSEETIVKRIEDVYKNILS